MEKARKIWIGLLGLCLLCVILAACIGGDLGGPLIPPGGITPGGEVTPPEGEGPQDPSLPGEPEEPETPVEPLDPSVCAHEFGEWTVSVPATCEQDGTDVRICPKCLSQEEQVAPALSHEFAATLAANEEGHFYPCTREGCSAYEEMGEHSFAPSNRCYSCLYRREAETAVFTLEQIEGGYMITSYNGNSENVTVPATYRGESVISIGKELFYGCAEIKRVTFASTNSIIEIGEGAFSGCTELSFIELPRSTERIGKRAFSGCTSLSGISFGFFGSNLREIDSYAFENCKKLSVFTVQSKVNYIGSYAFSGCSSLGNVTFAETSGWYVEGSPINVRWGGTNAINLTRDHVAGAFLRSQRTL